VAGCVSSERKQRVGSAIMHMHVLRTLDVGVDEYDCANGEYEVGGKGFCGLSALGRVTVGKPLALPGFAMGS